MAANLKSGGGAIANLLGKRLRNRTSTATRHHSNASAAPVSAFTTRSAHASAYDKNQEDHGHPTVVPDDVIQPQSDKYWAPHPQTGVFGPASELNSSAGGEQGSHSSDNGVDSILEEKAWFRPTNIEDLEKPHPV